MSVRITTDVFCDTCGLWQHGCVSHKAHIREAQQAAKKAGWTFKRNADCTCPKCNGSKPDYWQNEGRTQFLRG